MRPRQEITLDTREEIIDLHEQHYGTREIAKRVGLSRKGVRKILLEAGVRHPPATPGASKLDPHLEAIAARVGKGLTTSRILREICTEGYQGSRTILAEHVHRLRATLTLGPATKVKRRFETGPGQEMQIDWSPYTVPIGGRQVRVHALGCLLCWSRKLYLRVFADERQPTLLEGLADAFTYFGGVAHRVVLDNMATAVLGRVGRGRDVMWHPRFEAFAAHHGFSAFACAVKDPDRKGKKEKSFRLVWDDFVKGCDFASWDDLDRRRRVWLDETPNAGNLRVHGTTRRVPNEAWLDERPLLIRLPEARCPVHEDCIRAVDRDATLSVRGTRYTVPASLANRSVAVRLFAEHFEVLDAHGHIAMTRRYVGEADKGKLIIDPTHYASLPRRPHGDPGGRIDESFTRRFPPLAPLVDGLRRRLKALAPVHLRALVRLAEEYGEPAFLAAAATAQEYRRFDALAVERILEREHPLHADQATPLSGVGPAVLGEVEPGTLDHYDHLDADPPSPEADASTEDDDHGA